MGRKAHHRQSLLSIAAKAADLGASRSVHDRAHSGMQWHASGSCEAPVFVQLRSVEDGSMSEHQAFLSDGVTSVTKSLYLDAYVRCRRCPACLRARAALWRCRAIVETEMSQRTWFGTLTLRPEAHFNITSRARLRLAHNGLDFDALDASGMFAERHRIISGEITRFVKRVRKNSGADIRLICVAEAHKSGLPHYHLLIHERPGSSPVRHSCLTRAWQLGFTNWKLVSDGRAASYVCKYLSKSALARVRSSVQYGSPPSASGNIRPLP